MATRKKPPQAPSNVLNLVQEDPLNQEFEEIFTEFAERAKKREFAAVILITMDKDGLPDVIHNGPNLFSNVGLLRYAERVVMDDLDDEIDGDEENDEGD